MNTNFFSYHLIDQNDFKKVREGFLQNFLFFLEGNYNTIQKKSREIQANAKSH